MTARHLARLAGAAIAIAFAVSIVPTGVPTSSAAACPDVEVVFARGTFAPQGFGGIGHDFVNAVRSKVGDKSLDVYAVVYPASTDFPTAVDGIRDAANHIESMAATCPDTKLVLGGYSQGAAVIGFVTANACPAASTPRRCPSRCPRASPTTSPPWPCSARRITQFMQTIDQPPVSVGPLYAGKTIELCAPGDPICSDGDNGAAHTSYTTIGMTDQAATFVAGKV